MATHLCSECLEEGALHRCTRCLLTYYKDRDAQKRQWKLHKPVCAPITSQQKASMDAMSLDEATECFASTIFSDVNDTVYLLKHIRKLFDTEAPDPNDVELKLHGVCRGSFIFCPQDGMIYKFYCRPGMVDYLLTNNTEDLLNPKTRILKNKLAMYNGRPTDEYIENFISDPVEKERVKAACEEYDEAEDAMTWRTPSSMKFCYLYYNLIVGAAVHGNSSMASIHDGLGTLRGRKSEKLSRLAKAALTRAMELWKDPHVRASCGDAMAPAASLACTAMAMDRWDSQGTELIPGLTVDEAILACLSELGECAGSAMYSMKLFNEIVHAKPEISYEFMTLMPLQKRARVARSVVHYLMEHGIKDKDPGYGEAGVPAEALKMMLMMSCETEDKDGREVEIVRREIWQMCAEDEMLGPESCGRNCETRAFFHFLLRLTADDPNKMLTAASTIESWIKTKWPKIKKGEKHTPASLEKKECMKLAQGPEYHKEWCGWMDFEA